MLIRNTLVVAVLAALTSGAVAAEFSSDPNAATTEAVSVDMDAEAAEWRQVVDQGYQVPYGFSYSPIYDFGAMPIAIDAVRVQLFVEQGNRCNASLQAIDVAHTPDQAVFTRYTPDVNGVVVLPTQLLSKMMFHVYNPSVLRNLCIVRISVLPTDSTAPAPRDFELAGTLLYQGGFRNRIEMGVDTTDKVTAFKLRIPSFCRGLEILEAGTVTEGVFEAAELVNADELIYEVNGGAGSRIGAIQLSINGPRDADCEIPVYVSKAP